MTNVLAEFHLATPTPQHEQIAAFLRDQVRSGALAAGSRLPTTRELARDWGVHVTTVQAALAPLVKEGLLLRRPRLGTVVREAGTRLNRVAVFQPAGNGWSGAERFALHLGRMVAMRLEAAGIASVPMDDPRSPAEGSAKPWPALVRLARARRIDAVIACETNNLITDWLAKLPVPVAICGSGPNPFEIWHDFGQFARAGVTALAERGCRSVGLISVLPREEAADNVVRLLTRDMYHAFRAAVAATGLATREAWIRTPPDVYRGVECEAERFGFDQLRAMWSDPERPDGLLVFTDHAARGVIIALQGFLGGGVPAPRLVLHRNAEIGLFCPLPADFLEARVAAVADALIAAVECQHRRQPVASGRLPFTLVRGA